MRGSSMLLRYLVRPQREPARAGIIIAKKTFKKAVARNAIRRKLRAILSEALPLMPLGTLLLLIVGKNAQTLKSQALRSELFILLRQARLLPPPLTPLKK